MDHSSAGRQLGEYHLRELLFRSATRCTWLAEQGSIGRLVLIDELTDFDPQHHADFFAQARAKAAVDFPEIGSIYEAVNEPDLCFCAYERLPGKTLSDLQLSGQNLQTLSLVSVLHHIAEANLHLEAQGHATTPLDLADIHLEESGVVRLKNLATTGTRTPEQSTRDIIHLGERFRDLVARDWPGANRLLTLLAWMRGENVNQPLTWVQVRDYCGQITTQLTGNGTKRRASFQLPKFMLPALAGLLLIGLAVSGWFLLPKPAPQVKREPLPSPVEVAAGSHVTPDGSSETLEAFRISGHPVTNGEYLNFIKILDFLSKDGDEKIFDHPDQPASKATHQPAGWSSLSPQLAKPGNAALLDQPITGVDWWDAAAYANWQKTRLPTQDEWFAALDQKNGAAIYEWTQTFAANPANPLGEKRWVIIRSGKAREWLTARSTRRTDLGFRIILTK